MGLLDKLFTEKEHREAIFFRYTPESPLDTYADVLNNGSFSTIIVRKSFNEYVFFVNINSTLLDIRSIYDEEKFCFVVKSAHEVSCVENVLDLELVSHITETYAFAVKPDDRRYSNLSAVNFTNDLYARAESLDIYDVKYEEHQIEEEKKKIEAEEAENAQKQLEVWTKYIQQELALLNKANRPFVIAEAKPKVTSSHIDIKVSSEEFIIADTAIVNEIAQKLGCNHNDDAELVMNLPQFLELDIDKEEFSVTGNIVVQLRVKCEGAWKIQRFMQTHRYNRDNLRYTKDEERFVLSFATKSTAKVGTFYENVKNSYEFSRYTKPEYTIVRFQVKIKAIESDEDRRVRLNSLNGKELYTDGQQNGVLLGTLSSNNSGKNYLRISLPRDKENKKKAKDFFAQGGLEKTKIYPSLTRDIVLLNRQSEALRKIKEGRELQNIKLKDYIFNSGNASPIEQFRGLSSIELQSTVEYQDCASTRLMLLNPSQQEAVVKGVFANDLCLLQGPPGTGKTTVISELIWQHIRKNQSTRIMLTSQTNMAIDNALDRLRGEFASKRDHVSWRNKMLIKPMRVADVDVVEEEGLPFTRDRIEKWMNGNDESAQPNSNSDNDTNNNIVAQWLQHIALRTPQDTEYEDILVDWRVALLNPNKGMKKVFGQRYMDDYNILCMTCGKVDSFDFGKNKGYQGFDVVIVDEASKATLPELLMPLCYAKKSIVIGDHRQLPPVIFEGDFFGKLKEADPELEKELDKNFKHDLVEESLFKRLITHRFLSPTITATFNEQYRMHPQINNVVSKFYSQDLGGLKCGIDTLDADDPNLNNQKSRYHGFSFGSFINPNVHTIWVDVPDGIELGGFGDSSYNEREIRAVQLVIEALHRAEGFTQYMDFWAQGKSLEAKNTEGKIGVLSFYSAQVQRMRQSLQSYCDTHKLRVSTNSVDKFQGQERGIIVVSTVKTKNLGFTSSPERLNVALSRARRLLIIVGNSSFYSSEKAMTKDGQYTYRDVINQIKKDGNFIDYRTIEALLNNT